MVTRVSAAMVAADVATQSELDTGLAVKLTGDVIQRARTQTGAMSTGTTQMPVTTAATISEGTQVMSVSITPTSASSILRIEVCAHLAASVINTYGVVSLHAGAGALAQGCTYLAATANLEGVYVDHQMVAGTTSQITFTVRAGIHLAGTMTFNGLGGVARFGNTLASYIQVTEIKA